MSQSNNRKDASGSKSSASSPEACEDCVLHEAGSDTSDDDNIYQKWLPAVRVTVIAMYR